MRFGSYAAACALGILLCATASAQTTAPAAPAGTGAALATGLTEKGTAEASLVKALRDGDKLTITVRFRPVVKDSPSFESIYGGGDAKEIYLVSANKKYLILKDADEKWLAPHTLNLDKGLGSWSAVFPAPPAGQKATLHMPGVEPLGPFIVP